MPGAILRLKEYSDNTKKVFVFKEIYTYKFIQSSFPDFDLAIPGLGCPLHIVLVVWIPPIL